MRGVGLLWLILALFACSAETVEAPTQIMLRVSADPGLRAQLGALRVSVALREGNDFRAPVQKVFAGADLVWPVDIPILPRVSSDAFKEFEIVVDALQGERVLAQTRAVSGFVPRDRRVLTLTLYACPGPEPVCSDPSCSGDSCTVCAPNGQCVPVTRVDPSELPPLVVAHDAGSDVRAPDAELEQDAELEEPDAAGADPGAADAGDSGLPPGSSDAGTSLDGAGEPAADGALDPGTDGAVADGSVDRAFVTVRFSADDRHLTRVALSGDRLRVENRGHEVGNARSDGAIQPGSGTFYFEAERLIETLGGYGVGLATRAAPLGEALGHGGASVGLYSDGTFVTGGAPCPSLTPTEAFNQRRYGFVIDYRGTSPTLHVLIGSGQEARVACTMASSWREPVFLFYSGSRYQVGAQIAINTGADTTNFPFAFSLAQVRAALTAAQQPVAATALVPGFGQTRALPASAAPVLSPPADVSVAAGEEVVLLGSASDAEDGNLSAQIRWEDLSALHPAPTLATGPSLRFRPTLGRHPLRMSVTDSVGRTSSATVMVTATGSVLSATPPAVKLVADELSDPSVNLDAAGLSIDFRAFEEGGLRANQAIYGQYWYFEAERLFSGPASISVGVIVREGALKPLDFENIPWCASLHMTGLTAYNMNGQATWAPENDHYGFAVDYRGLHPILHIIVGGAPGVQPYRVNSITLNDVWKPLYPFVSGVWLDDDSASFDARINFGASPFFFDPVAVLGSGRADGLQLGWGAHARAP
ncbi:MAG TPA: hypothetical protein VFZ61_04820 [Polyangiales bacterium]